LLAGWWPSEERTGGIDGECRWWRSDDVMGGKESWRKIILWNGVLFWPTVKLIVEEKNIDDQLFNDDPSAIFLSDAVLRLLTKFIDPIVDVKRWLFYWATKEKRYYSNWYWKAVLSDYWGIILVMTWPIIVDSRRKLCYWAFAKCSGVKIDRWHSASYCYIKPVILTDYSEMMPGWREIVVIRWGENYSMMTNNMFSWCYSLKVWAIPEMKIIRYYGLAEQEDIIRKRKYCYCTVEDDLLLMCDELLLTSNVIIVNVTGIRVLAGWQPSEPFLADEGGWLLSIIPSIPVMVAPLTWLLVAWRLKWLKEDDEATIILSQPDVFSLLVVDL